MIQIDTETLKKSASQMKENSSQFMINPIYFYDPAIPLNFSSPAGYFFMTLTVLLDCEVKRQERPDREMEAQDMS